MSEANVQKAVSALISTASAAAAAGSTPEEAYKRFMSVAGKGMMQVMADALAAAVGQGLKATEKKKGVAGWEKFVKGCAVTMDFGAPIDLAALAHTEATAVDFQKILLTKLQDSVKPETPSGVHAFGGSITIGGSWSF